MSKNRKFKNSYIVTVEGTTSNGFQAQMFDDVLRAVAVAFSSQHASSEVSIKVLDTLGDYDAELRGLKVKDNGQGNM